MLTYKINVIDALKEKGLNSTVILKNSTFPADISKQSLNK